MLLHACEHGRQEVQPPFLHTDHRFKPCFPKSLGTQIEAQNPGFLLQYLSPRGSYVNVTGIPPHIQQNSTTKSRPLSPSDVTGVRDVPVTSLVAINQHSASLLDLRWCVQLQSPRRLSRSLADGPIKHCLTRPPPSHPLPRSATTQTGHPVYPGHPDSRRFPGHTRLNQTEDHGGRRSSRSRTQKPPADLGRPASIARVAPLHEVDRKATESLHSGDSDVGPIIMCALTEIVTAHSMTDKAAGCAC